VDIVCARTPDAGGGGDGFLNPYGALFDIAEPVLCGGKAYAGVTKVGAGDDLAELAADEIVL
jgi:hypothetical protein